MQYSVAFDLRAFERRSLCSKNSLAKEYGESEGPEYVREIDPCGPKEWPIFRWCPSRTM